MKLFIDANVLFSAANGSSNLNRLLLRLAVEHVVITSDYAQQEAARNIRSKRPQWETEFTEIIQRITIVQSVDRPLDVEIVDKDRPILATAISHQCDYLVTGDKRDFGHLFGRAVGGVEVITPLGIATKLVS